MRTGVTATQRGLTRLQQHTIEDLLRADTDTERELHHGDCIGGDALIHDLAELVTGYRILIHPPSDSRKRAFCIGTSTFEPKPYLDRNHDIVDATERLIAAPKGFMEELRSGTWATVRYARRKGKPVIIVYPDGRTA